MKLPFKTPGPPNKMPRGVKYAWGGIMTLLLAGSMYLDRGHELMPLIHRAIDLMQVQTAPIPNK
jgi:hypothetical protein